VLSRTVLVAREQGWLWRAPGSRSGSRVVVLPGGHIGGNGADSSLPSWARPPDLPRGPADRDAASLVEYGTYEVTWGVWSTTRWGVSE